MKARVETGETQVVAHAGSHALGSFADRLGLGRSLSGRFVPGGERRPVHDRGTVLTHAMLMLAGGGEACTDIEFLRSQEGLFGLVASDTTLYRTVRHEMGPAVVAGVRAEVAGIREKVWSRSTATTGTGTVVLDIDSSLVGIHSENKVGTGPTYKGGYGFHPMFCFADATGETLAGLLRPGNPGLNTVTDHLLVLDEAIGQLPPQVRAGHQLGDDPGLVGRAVQVRADSAGCTHGFVHGCRARNVGFAVVARSNSQIHTAISKIRNDDRWQPALRPNGEPRDGSMVCEVTDLVDLTSWPAGTRLILRREPLHPGAQTSLFPDLENRYWGHYTDSTGTPNSTSISGRMPMSKTTSVV